MIPASFSYQRPRTLEEAIGLLAQNQDAKVLSGGHSLIPAMKLRLAQPGMIIDISRIPDLAYIREVAGKIAIGATTTHYEIEASELLRGKCPLLSELTPQIGDMQVRNKGTIGGSLAHADPAADWPAAILALDAELEIAGPNGRRTVAAADFFVDMMQTALQANEILCEIRVPATDSSVAYAKAAQKASGFAIAGVAVVLNLPEKKVSVGVTGVGPKAYRATSVESALNGKGLSPELIHEASAGAAANVEPLGDMHASAEFRAHLARVHCRRAIERALARAS